MPNRETRAIPLSRRGKRSRMDAAKRHTDAVLREGVAADRPISPDIGEIREFEPLHLPIWREVFVGMEWLHLLASGILCGRDVPRGDGSPVVLVPGFLASDVYLGTFASWFKRIGYRPYMSEIGRNADCPNLLIRYLLTTVERAHNETGRKVHLVGHSLGGVLSRAAGAFRPDLVASVTMLGSPIRGVRVHPVLLTLSDLVHRKVHLSSLLKPFEKRPEHPSCYTASCACGFACVWRGDFPHEIPQLAVYTKNDGVVDWNVCITGDRRYDVEVDGTHCGMVWNPDVYRIVARRLASYSKKPRTRTTRRTSKKAAA